MMDYCSSLPNVASLQAMTNAFASTQAQIDYHRQQLMNLHPFSNYMPSPLFNPLDYHIWQYRSTGPKSGRPVYKDLGDCWIVIAFESGPLKLLEIELK